MSRELKFRAWVKASFGNYMDTEVWIDCDGCVWEKATRTYDTPNTEIEPVEVLALMQFTGLKDKGGKEIFDGDILGGHPHGEAWVEYDSKFACWACKWYAENPDWDGDDALTQHVTVSDLLCNQLEDCGDAWEVIGNIHEHPDLVTK